MDLPFWCGWAGALLVLVGYYFTVFREWPADSGKFMLLSSVAALLLIYSAAESRAYPFVVVNAAIPVVTALTIGRKGIK